MAISSTFSMVAVSPIHACWKQHSPADTTGGSHGKPHASSSFSTMFCNLIRLAGSVIGGKSVLS